MDKILNTLAGMDGGNVVGFYLTQENYENYYKRTTMQYNDKPIYFEDMLPAEIVFRGKPVYLSNRNEPITETPTSHQI